MAVDRKALRDVRAGRGGPYLMAIHCRSAYGGQSPRPRASAYGARQPTLLAVRLAGLIFIAGDETTRRNVRAGRSTQWKCASRIYILLTLGKLHTCSPKGHTTINILRLLQRGLLNTRLGNCACDNTNLAAQHQRVPPDLVKHFVEHSKCDPYFLHHKRRFIP